MPARLIAGAGPLASLILCCILGTVTPVAAQVSPGPLARAHRELDGSLKCTKCHGGGSDAMPARCVACHRDIGWLAERGRGFHGTKQTQVIPCANCHPDHAGIDFQLIRWPQGSHKQFDHRTAGWPLEQSHSKIECDKCHTPTYQVSPAAALVAKKPARWTGLEPGCASCHVDPHRQALGSRCTECHDAGKWAVTPGFDHDSTSYPLTGRHAAVKCDACHLSGQVATKVDAKRQRIPVYKPVPHEGCGACHRDVHDGRFGAECDDCHTTSGFTKISGDRFDHSRTRYPLRGRHIAAACAACHGSGATEQRRPPFASCSACHRPDPHNGTGTLAGKPADCAACHTESGFAPSTYDRSAHRSSRYPLEGKHASVPCASCHRKDQARAATLGSAKVVLRPAFALCGSCHPDDHGGQLASRNGGGECSQCHRVAGWRETTYDSAAHAELRLGLDGRHAKIACRACHGSDRKSLPPHSIKPTGKAAFVFALAEVECASCHLDPHGGRYAAKGARPIERGCLACHNAVSFESSTAGPEQHASFGFVLAGAHRATPCAACHSALGATSATPPSATLIGSGAKLRELRLSAPTSCAACHETVHGSQFATRIDAGRCDACHDDSAFRPAVRFEHDRDAAFALKGGHQRVRCEACHRTMEVAGTKIVGYRPLSGKCESCHDRGGG